MFFWKKKRMGTQVHISMSASLVHRREERQSGGWKRGWLSKHPG
jgi:hypothetical protein